MPCHLKHGTSPNKQQIENGNRLHRNVRHLKNMSSRRMQRCCRSILGSCLPFRHTAHIWGEQLLRQKPLASLYRKQFQALQHYRYVHAAASETTFFPTLARLHARLDRVRARRGERDTPPIDKTTRSRIAIDAVLRFTQSLGTTDSQSCCVRSRVRTGNLESLLCSARLL